MEDLIVARSHFFLKAGPATARAVFIDGQEAVNLAQAIAYPVFLLDLVAAINLVFALPLL